MNLETQDKYLKIIEQDFIGIKNMLTHIQELITQYPVYTQLEFMKPLKMIVFEALQDALNDKNTFLNTYDGGDTIEIDKIEL